MNTCAHKNVYITEALTWKAFRENQNDEYGAHNKDCEITAITCEDCEHDFTQEEISSVRVNFN